MCNRTNYLLQFLRLNFLYYGPYYCRHQASWLHHITTELGGTRHSLNLGTSVQRFRTPPCKGTTTTLTITLTLNDA